MVSPAARGLFVRAIVESGLGREPAPPLAEAERAGEAFAAKVGLANATASDLRKLSTEQILEAGDPDLRAGGGSICDGQILTMGPMQAFTKGLEAKVPYIVGWNSLEYPAPAAAREKVLDLAVPADKRSQLAAAYPDPESYAAHVVSDLLFNEPAFSLARLHAAHGQPTWIYQFSVLSSAVRTVRQGAPHASERQYAFKTLNASPWPTDANDVVQSDIMSAYWVAFAKTGDPNGSGRAPWPAYDTTRDELLDFTNSGPVAVKPPRRSAMDAITALYR